MTNYDYTNYQVFGERGDWGLRVKDENGEFSYIDHYARLRDAKTDGRFFTHLYKAGKTSEEIFG